MLLETACWNLEVHSLFPLIRSVMGKKRKVGESREPQDVGERQPGQGYKLRSRKKTQKEKRDQRLDSSRVGEQSKDQEKQREKKRKKDQLNNEGIQSSYLPGQIHETPNERDPFRIFLETLYQQLPEDDFARMWMIEWGLLPHEEASKVLEKRIDEKDVLSDGGGKAKTTLKKKKVRL